MKYDAVYEVPKARAPSKEEEACGCARPQAQERSIPYAKRVRAPRGRSAPELTNVGKGAKGLGLGCRPWTKIERDEKKYEACMAVAEKIGPIDSSKKAFEILKRAVGVEDQEVFGAMYLDTHLYLRDFAETARGEVDAVMAPIKPTLRIATLRLAMDDLTTGLLVFHCHPTLYSEPSDADKDVTRSFEDACEALDLFFVDHVIVGGMKEFYSFADAGLLRDRK